MTSRSPFFYVGDKYKLIKQLKKLFPTNINRLIEPFCGGGSVFLNIEANSYLANDNNAFMIKLHKFFKSYKNLNKFTADFEKTINSYGLSASYLGKEAPAELKKKFVKTYYARFNSSAYLKLREDFNKDKTNLMLLYTLLIYGFNHMLRFNSNGDFNLPVGNVDYNKNVHNALSAYFDFIKKHKIKFFCQDFRKFIYNLKFEKGDFIYLDPPYLISASEYNKFWDIKEENDLLKAMDYINDNGVEFALSNVFIHKGNKNDLLMKWAKKYYVYHINSNYISYHDNTIKNTVEVLVTNYKVKGEKLYEY